MTTPDMPETVVLGMWFEDFVIGQSFHTAGRTITETDVVNFAGLTGDYSQVHTDEEFCKKTEFGTRIAHGLLGLAIVQALGWRTNYTQGTGIASVGYENWRFMKPILIGDTVRGRYTPLAKRESKSNPKVGIVTVHIELINQRGEVVQDGKHLLMVRRKPSGN
jgi:acyl dehydratase